MSKKEEAKLTLTQNIQLRLHLRICDFCTRFQKQVRFFTRNAPHSHQHLSATMNDEKKEVIKTLLKE